MISRRWLFGVMVVVPIVGLLAAEGLRAYSNSELREAIREQYPNADPGRVAEITVAQLCDGAELVLEAMCETDSRLSLMARTAVIAGIFGFALLAAIRLAGYCARTSRQLLLRTFKPGLYLTAVSVIVLMAIHASVAAAALWYVETMLVGRVHVGLILAIGIGALLGVVAIGRNTFSVVCGAETFVIGKRLDRKQGRRLYERVDALAKTLGALRPQHIVVGLDPNFFVTEAKVGCLNGTLSGRTLYCSLPLSRIMTTTEWEAVIGHELGHFKGQDTKFSQEFYPIYKGTANSLSALRHSATDGAHVVALLPAIAVLTYFYEAFAVAESRHSRERELGADRDGASLESSKTMASALVKVHAFSDLWRGVQEAAVAAIEERRSFINLSQAFSLLVTQHANAETISAVGGTHTMHPTDSHPTLDVRLQALDVSMNEIREAALDVTPSDVALSLIEDCATLEEDLSATYQGFLARQAGVDLES